MTTNGLNTLEYTERLMRAGVPEEQAKAQALVLYEIINSTLATKRDIEELKSATKRDIADVQKDIKELDVKIETIRADLKRDVADLKRDIKELDVKIETIRAEIKRDIKDSDKNLEGNLDRKMNYKMAAASAGVVLTILSCLVTLGKLGLLTPTSTP